MPDSNAPALIGVFLTAVGLGVGLYQYRRNSKRERAIMAANQTKEFHEDDDVRFVMQLLDYGAAPFWKEGSLKGQSFPVSDLPDALKVHWKTAPNEPKPELFSDQHLAVRSAFDGFLLRLERIEHLILNNVISVSGFQDLFSYWLILLGEIPQPDDKIAHLSDDARKALWSYIRSYQFSAVVRLFARYGRADPDESKDGFKARTSSVPQEAVLAPPGNRP